MGRYEVEVKYHCFECNEDKKESEVIDRKDWTACKKCRNKVKKITDESNGLRG